MLQLSFERHMEASRQSRRKGLMRKREGIPWELLADETAGGVWKIIRCFVFFLKILNGKKGE